MSTRHPRHMAGRLRVHAIRESAARSLIIEMSPGKMIEVARVRPCEHLAVHYSKGNARKLAAGWNLIEAIRTEDIASLWRVADGRGHGGDIAKIARVAAALGVAFSTLSAPSTPGDGDSDG